MTNWAIGWRVLVIVVLLTLAWGVPDLLGLDVWVGLVLGVIVVVLVFSLGIGNVGRPPSN